MRSCQVCPIDCVNHAECRICSLSPARCHGGMPGMGRLLVVRGRHPVLVLHWQQHTPGDSATQPPHSLSTPPDRAVAVSHVRYIRRVILLIGFQTLLGAACTGLLARVPTDALRAQCSFEMRIVNCTCDAPSLAATMPQRPVPAPISRTSRPLTSPGLSTSMLQCQHGLQLNRALA